ncbi:hypothetical+protein [Methylocapsa aurea]|jgi:hypothetical protein
MRRYLASLPEMAEKPRKINQERRPAGADWRLKNF